MLILRSADVPEPTWDHGAAEHGHRREWTCSTSRGRDLYEPLDLGIGTMSPVRRRARCSAGGTIGPQIHLRVATKYPVLTRRHLQARGITAEIIQALRKHRAWADHGPGTPNRRPGRDRRKPCAKTALVEVENPVRSEQPAGGQPGELETAARSDLHPGRPPSARCSTLGGVPVWVVDGCFSVWRQ